MKSTENCDDGQNDLLFKDSEKRMKCGDDMSDIARAYCVSILGSVCLTFGRKKETGYFIEAQNVPSTLTCNRYTKRKIKSGVAMSM